LSLASGEDLFRHVADTARRFRRSAQDSRRSAESSPSVRLLCRVQTPPTGYAGIVLPAQIPPRHLEFIARA
jgi:hypothetical protein